MPETHNQDKTGVSTGQSTEAMLQAYLQALSAGDAPAAAALFDERALLEIPFLRPNRLVGAAEIGKAHRAIFATLDSLEFEAIAIDSDASHAIAEGTLRFSRAGDKPRTLAAGVVAETGVGGLRRISLYCDARNIRPWSDEAIL